MGLFTGKVRQLGLSVVIGGCFCVPVLAGEVVVTRSSEHFDAFAVRDQVLKDFEWQESLRRQEQIQILQALPIGCIPQMRPYPYYTCGENSYRPYNYQQREVYIKVDNPQK